ncbi:WSC domain protein [Cordyceps fumosorosea ARSEF 2679]|uniref:WSC domain protein n=1 Tax=Cordyceps fumosorosea (strain ARSEF 2679) TaxID=1081104 RepID=A0A167ZG08_CORFA|nr:WSC domain protein [Cordyceps fumosorosea ARSEF 2679]OAA67471.1 WSC domain protein [Cordyceps fumosorosea ARSEF 2679]
MKFNTAAALASLLGVAAAAKDKRTFAVLHFTNKQLTVARADPIVTPGKPSTHVHHILGGSGFSLSSTGADLPKSNCSTAKVKGDNSNYWFPSLYFKDPKSSNLESVELFYANVYYFFEPTNDDIKAFPMGLQMLIGDPSLRTPPAAGATSNLDPSKGPVQPIKWTCPRKDLDKPGWPLNSKGLTSGMQDPQNKGEGVGFPDVACDGYASPLRADVHFPSCYNPQAGLTDYKNNMAWPQDNKGKADCPKGWIHVPHLFFEAYWNTPAFSGRWEQGKGQQPFVLANGDVTGYSLHADFMSGWDEPLLQHIIDTCDAGTTGMENCAGLFYGQNKDECTIQSPVDEKVTGILTALPGSNSLTGWSYGAGDKSPQPSQGQSSSAAPAPSSSAPPQSSASAPASSVRASSAPASSAPASSASGVPSSSASSGVSTKPASPSQSGSPVQSSASSQTQSSNGPSPTLPTAPASSGECKPGTVHTVYKTVTVTGTAIGTATATAPVSTSTGGAGNPVGGFKYAGCFKDTASRALNGKVRPNIGRMSNEKCVAECKKLGFSAAGTEYGGQCYCGNELVGSERLDNSACNITCEDNATSQCGGSWALSVYSETGEVNMKNAQRRRHAHDHLKRHSGRF